MGKNKNGKDRYVIMFQLSSDKLKLYYNPDKDLKSAWSDIRKFLKKHKFDFVKDTTYISKRKLSEPKISQVINELFTKYPWLALSNDTMKCMSINQELDINQIIALNKALVTEIEVLQEFPPGLDREDFSLGKGQSNQPQKPTPKTPETVTIPISELKKSIEMGVDSEITISKKDWEKIQKQTEAKKKSSAKKQNSDKQDKATKPHKPKR